VALEGAVAQRIALVDVVNSLLDKGTVISGQATVSVAGVDLVHVALNLLVSSVETLQRAGSVPSNVLSAVPQQPSPGTRAPFAGGGSATSPHSVTSGSALEVPSLVPYTTTPFAADPPTLLSQGEAEQQRDQGLAGLVLALVELIRQLLERQAVRRMEGGTLTEDEVERMGRALMELNAKMKELFAMFGLDETDVNLDLGPLGQLL
jgi:hypothetical protein